MVGSFGKQYEQEQKGNAYNFDTFTRSDPTAHFYAKSYIRNCYPVEDIQAVAANGTVQKLTWHQDGFPQVYAFRYLLYLLSHRENVATQSVVSFAEGFQPISEEKYSKLCDDNNGNDNPGNHGRHFHWLDIFQRKKYDVLTKGQLMYTGPWQYHFYHIPKTGKGSS